MRFVDSKHIERVAYFNFHGDTLLTEHAIFAAACERWAGVAKRCGAFERPALTAEQYVANLLETAANPLAEEVVDYIGAG